MDSEVETTYLETKEQVLNTFRSWGVSADIPRKGYRTIVQLPGRWIVSVTYSEHKSDVGKRLYNLIMTPWGTVPSWQKTP